MTHATAATSAPTTEAQRYTRARQALQEQTDALTAIQTQIAAAEGRLRERQAEHQTLAARKRQLRDESAWAPRTILQARKQFQEVPTEANEQLVRDAEAHKGQIDAEIERVSTRQAAIPAEIDAIQNERTDLLAQAQRGELLAAEYRQVCQELSAELGQQRLTETLQRYHEMAALAQSTAADLRAFHEAALREFTQEWPDLVPALRETRQQTEGHLAQIGATIDPQGHAARREKALAKAQEAEGEIASLGEEIAAIEATLATHAATRQATAERVAALKPALDALPAALAKAEATAVLAEDTPAAAAAHDALTALQAQLADGTAAYAALVAEQDDERATLDADDATLRDQRDALIAQRQKLSGLIVALKDQAASAWRDQQTEAVQRAEARLNAARADLATATAGLAKVEREVYDELSTTYYLTDQARRLVPQVHSPTYRTLDAFARYLQALEEASSNGQHLLPRIFVAQPSDPDKVIVNAPTPALLFLRDTTIGDIIMRGDGYLGPIQQRRLDIERVLFHLANMTNQ